MLKKSQLLLVTIIASLLTLIGCGSELTKEEVIEKIYEDGNNVIDKVSYIGKLYAENNRYGEFMDILFRLDPKGNTSMDINGRFVIKDMDLEEKTMSQLTIMKADKGYTAYYCMDGVCQEDHLENNELLDEQGRFIMLTDEVRPLLENAEMKADRAGYLFELQTDSLAILPPYLETYYPDGQLDVKVLVSKDSFQLIGLEIDSEMDDPSAFNIDLGDGPASSPAEVEKVPSKLILTNFNYNFQEKIQVPEQAARQ